MAFGVRDQLDCYVINPRIMRERSVRELGKLLVIASGKTRSNFTDVFLYDVPVVEQPFACRADVDSPFRGIGQPVVYFSNYASCVVEAIEQRPVPALLLDRKQPVFPRNVARVLCQPVRAEYFATDWTDELPVTSVSPKTEKPKYSVLRFFGGNCCRCH